MVSSPPRPLKWNYMPLAREIHAPVLGNARPLCGKYKIDKVEVIPLLVGPLTPLDKKTLGSIEIHSWKPPIRQITQSKPPFLNIEGTLVQFYLGHT